MPGGTVIRVLFCRIGKWIPLRDSDSRLVREVILLRSLHGFSRQQC